MRAIIIGNVSVEQISLAHYLGIDLLGMPVQTVDYLTDKTLYDQFITHSKTHTPVLTSSKASDVIAIWAERYGLPDGMTFFSIGKKTSAPISHFTSVIESEKATAKALLSCLNSHAISKVCHFTGNQKRPELSSALGENYIHLEVYHTHLLEPDQILKQLPHQIDCVGFLSPATAAYFLSVYKDPIPKAIAIGQTTFNEIASLIHQQSQIRVDTFVLADDTSIEAIIYKMAEV